MLSRTVARRYAKGLLGAVVKTRGEEHLRPVLDEVLDLVEAVEGHGGLRLLLANPAVRADRKAAVVDDIAGRLDASDITRRFLRHVADKERLDHLEAIAEVYAELVDERLGVVDARVSSPVPLDDEAVDELRRQLSEATGKQVRLRVRTDPDLLGGLVTRIGDMVYDGSLRSHLSRLRTRMVSGQ